MRKDSKYNPEGIDSNINFIQKTQKLKFKTFSANQLTNLTTSLHLQMDKDGVDRILEVQKQFCQAYLQTSIC